MIISILKLLCFIIPKKAKIISILLPQKTVKTIAKKGPAAEIM